MSEIKRSDSRSVERYIEHLGQTASSATIRVAGRQSGNNVASEHGGNPAIVTEGLRLSQFFGGTTDIGGDNDQFLGQDNACPECHTPMRYDDGRDQFICGNPDCEKATSYEGDGVSSDGLYPTWHNEKRHHEQHAASNAKFVRIAK
jgi:hypothetical protein